MATRSHEKNLGNGAASPVEINVFYDQKKLRELKKAIRNAGNEARRGLRSRLKAAGQKVQREIMSRAPVHGGSYGTQSRMRATSRIQSGKVTVRTAKHAPGLLRKSTKLKISTLSVAVYNDAKSVSARYPGGYRYGRRLEFDTNSYGSRYEFFYPGWEAKKDEAIAEVRKILDDVARQFGSSS